MKREQHDQRRPRSQGVERDAPAVFRVCVSNRGSRHAPPTLPLPLALFSAQPQRLPGGGIGKVRWRQAACEGRITCSCDIADMPDRPESSPVVPFSRAGLYATVRSPLEPTVTEVRQVTAEDGQVVVRPRAVAGRPPGMGHALRLVPNRTAVVIIDVQLTVSGHAALCRNARNGATDCQFPAGGA